MAHRATGNLADRNVAPMLGRSTVAMPAPDSEMSMIRTPIFVPFVMTRRALATFGTKRP